MTFNTNKLYRDELPLQFGNLNLRQLADVFRDGRAAALPVYYHLIAKHRLIEIHDPNNPANCVSLSDGQILQVRIITGNGIQLNPHRQNGCCRQVDHLEHQQRQLVIHGYIFVDVTAMPEITYAYVPKDRVVKLNYNYGDAVSALLWDHPES